MSVRYALLGGHPRKQLNFTLESLHAAEKALCTYCTALPDSSGDPRIFASVLNALEDDLNLPAALGALFTVVHRGPDAAKRTAFGRAIFALGLKLDGPESTKARSSRRHYETGAGAVGCEAGERLQDRRRPAR